MSLRTPYKDDDCAATEAPEISAEAETTQDQKFGNLSVEQLRSLIERIERLEEEKAKITANIRDVFAEAKAHGYDVKAMRHVLRLRKLDNHERDEQQHMQEVYLRALGMLPELQ